MNFKEQMQNDIKSVFLNFNEFGDTHNIDGVNRLAIVDDDALKQQTLKSAPGTYLGELLFHIASTDLPGKPVEGQKMKFDNESYKVKRVENNDGIYSITLGSNQS